MNLNQDQQKKIDDVIDLIKRMQLGEDIIFAESLRKRIFQDIIQSGVVDLATDINDSTIISAGGGTVNHPKEYDKRAIITIDGEDYYIGLYNT